MTLQRRGIILSLDGLGARSLGPYGNAWYKTAHFNRLAGDGLLFEHCLAQYPCDPAKWFGYFMESGETTDIELRLLSDDRLAVDSLQSTASQITFLQPKYSDRPVDDWIESELARFFSAATDEVQELAPGQCLLLHSRALTHCWDAPFDFRESLADEDDPEVVGSTLPPSQSLPDDFDQDELFGWQQNYGAQIEVLDRCLGVLLDLIEELPIADQPFLAVTGTRGFPLGEHRQLGFEGESLFDEVLHVPGLIRWPGESPSGVRALDLTTPERLFRLAVAHILHQPIAATSLLENPWPNKRRQFVRSECGSSRTVRTHAWKYLRSAGLTGKLFAKPDDRFDQNDVADRCPGIVSQLEELLDSSLEGQEQMDLPPELAFGLQ